ncbi:hypothetical protein [Clostridium sp. Ade.TY]|uniref:hypothetical protein n=1 Tax=Clostridium sp. Ade.TY TaxID=1391647 RepID=UPI00040C75B1|nr:hypothetical protein [Clostridium sp. Ade.TY]
MEKQLLEIYLYLVLGIIYGVLLFNSFKKLFKFEDKGQIIRNFIAILFLIIGYTIAIFTRKVWFIVFPIILMIALLINKNDTLGKYK